MAVNVKFCPRCGTQAALDAKTCSSCGRAYRTQFVGNSPVPPAELPTQAFIAPLHQPSPPPAPDYSQYQTDAVLMECGRQYVSFTWMRILSVFLIPVFLVGLFLWLYFSNQEMSLRQRVAALGVDAELWEAPYRKQRIKTYAILFGIPIVLLVAICLWAGIVGTAASVLHPAASSPADNSDTDPTPGYPHLTSVSKMADLLHYGMSPNEVGLAIGVPDREDKGSDDYIPTEDFSYTREDGTLDLHFKNYALESWQTH